MRALVIGFILAFSGLAVAQSIAPQAQKSFDAAERALNDKKFDLAIKNYKSAIKKSPSFAAALNGLGSVYFKQNKKAEAVEQFKLAVAADSKFKLAWFNLGYALRKLNDYSGAVTAYEKYTTLDTKDPDGFYGLAESYRLSDQPAKSVTAYETYVSIETRPTETKWVDQAKEWISSLKRLDKPAVELTEAQKKIAEGDTLLKDKRFREATFAFTDASNLEPNNAEARFKLGNSLATLGYLERAIQQWENAMRLSPDATVRRSADDNIQKARTKMQTTGANPQTGSESPSVAEVSRDKARDLYKKGSSLVTKGAYNDALPILTQTIELEPMLSLAYVARGSALVGLRRYVEAQTDYQYALKLNAQLAAPLYGLAEVSRVTGKSNEAKEFYQRYIASQSADVNPDLKKDAEAKLQALASARP